MLLVLISAVTLTAFLALAAIGESRRWRHPILSAFMAIWVSGAALAYVHNRDAIEVTRTHHAWSPATRGTLVELVGLTLYLSILAAVSTITDRQRMRTRVVLTTAVAVPAVVISFAALLYANCMADFGCI